MNSRYLNITRRGIIVIVALWVAAVPSAVVLAHEGEDHNTQTQTIATEPSELDPAQRAEAFKRRQSAEVERRLQVLRTLHQRVGRSSELSTAYKNNLANQISQEVQAMEAIKLEIAAATTPEVLRTLSARLSSEFKVYALLVPKANLLRVIDRQLVNITKMEALAAKLQSRIDQAIGQKQDIGSLETQLITVTQSLARARQQAQQAELAVAALTPTDLVNDRRVLQAYHEDVVSAHREFMKAVRTARDMVGALAKLPTANKQ